MLTPGPEVGVGLAVLQFVDLSTQIGCQSIQLSEFRAGLTLQLDRPLKILRTLRGLGEVLGKPTPGVSDRSRSQAQDPACVGHVARQKPCQRLVGDLESTDVLPD